jgi:hypothetical protein
MENCMRRVAGCFAALVLLMVLANGRIAAQREPANGVDVLTRMHDAYAGKWYHTLTFTQRTTQYRPNGTTNTSTWCESLRHTSANGVQLRIDIGAPSDGNGMLYTARPQTRHRRSSGSTRRARSSCG